MFNVFQRGESGDSGLILGEITGMGVRGKFGENGVGTVEKRDPGCGDVPEGGAGE
jgi:hypothetical protein